MRLCRYQSMTSTFVSNSVATPGYDLYPPDGRRPPDDFHELTFY